VVQRFFFSLPNVLVTNDREAFFKLYVVDLLLSSNEVCQKLAHKRRKVSEKFIIHSGFSKCARRPAISPFTFTFPPVKNLSSMSFQAIFMFM
jgi:hypothetical protein